MQQYAWKEKQRKNTQRGRRPACKQQKDHLYFVVQPALEEEEWPQHQQEPPQAFKIR